MAINFSEDVYLLAFNQFARPITVLPVASQPGMPPYDARGIYDTGDQIIEGEDGLMISDQKTILDIREAEFTVLPLQLDRITIPDHAGVAGGEFEVTDADTNGGGETTLSLRKLEDPKP